MTRFKIIIPFLLITVGFKSMYSQNKNNDTIQLLAEKSYESLSDTFLTYQSKKNTSLSLTYGKAFLLKAKNENDIIKKAEGYYMLADTYKVVPEYEKALQYSDSIITITKDIKDYSYPAKAHLLKANILGSQGDFQNSMSELAEANIYANENENVEQQYQIKYFIALLKSNLDEKEESLEILKSVVAYYKTKYLEDEKYKHEYITSLYAYGNAFNILEQYDSVQKVNNEAIRLTLTTKDSSLYDRLLLSSAVVHFNKKEYQSSLDSIQKLQKLNLKKKASFGTEIRTNLFLGQIYFKQNNLKAALPYLIKVDSAAFKEEYYFPYLRDNYESLIQYYKQDKNDKKQLFYINRLLKVDSLLDDDIKYLARHINEQYSKPNLILEKQQIIETLEKNNVTKIIVLINLLISLIILIFVLIRNNKKQKLYKKRFQELLENKNSQEVSVSKDQKVKTNQENKPKDIGISEIIVNDILKNLVKFEENNDFLQSNISVSSLSKRFKTNSKYLSKVINVHKNKSFSNYVNELRINYVVEELKINTKFRKYTIRAIANEIGFNTTEAFSKSFFKTTGIYPSFFMKQLEKQENPKTY
ncbi:AraC family transcriptional regulator [uncultured Dokdonia sp.]|uniref:helix-turn-helix domain-containing protein n=1 Tax=uncultured Dokdonia sp. TaxID=575653 RepID=UPI0026238FF5|nr:AraC family transcriptional regulator [uncultured Dokdonia sp.]